MRGFIMVTNGVARANGERGGSCRPLLLRRNKTDHLRIYNEFLRNNIGSHFNVKYLHTDRTGIRILDMVYGRINMTVIQYGSDSIK